MTEALRHFDHFTQTGPPLPLWLLTLLIVAAPTTLLHEIGHAVAARIRLDGAVRIRVGGDPPVWRFSAAGIDVGVRPLFVPFGITGACEFDGAASAADAVAVALAGPAASIVGAIASGVALGSATPGSFAHAALWQATAVQAFSVVLCVLPLTLANGNGVHHTDGWIALDALRRIDVLQPRTTRVARTAPPQTPATTVSSPACGACTHPRSEHVDLATGRRGPCRGQDFDFQTLAASVCSCPAYVPAS